MRITATQLIFALCFIGSGYAHDSNAQSLLGQKISIMANGSEVKKILNQVEKQADVRFVFSSKLIKSGRCNHSSVIRTQYRRRKAYVNIVGYCCLLHFYPQL